MDATKVEVYRGDTSEITISVTDSAGAAFDLTGYTMKMTVKTNRDDADAAAVIPTKTATISSPTTGVGVFNLTTTDTAITPGAYWYDVQINDGTDDVRTILVSKFIVLQDVTQS